MKKIDLNGIWRMTGNGYDVEGTVPGSVYSFLHVENKILPDPYYRDNEDLYTSLMYEEYTFERSFDYEKGAEQGVALVFEGLDTLCSVYLNGKLVGETENMHVRYEFDVRDVLHSGKNLLQVVCHPVLSYMKAKNLENRLFGAYDCMEGYPHVRKAHCMMGWDWGPRLPDAGIWRGVYLLVSDSARITDVKISQRHADGKVYLLPQVEMHGEAEVAITLTDLHGNRVMLRHGMENEIQEPLLWWPNGMGAQNLYGVLVELFENGVAVDEKRMRIGLREMKLVRRADAYGESFYHEINGIDMFAMGADYIPEDNLFSRITPERTRRLLEHCKDCHFNAIRVWGGGYYPDDFFFDFCDELGLVVFFDLMFACSTYEPDARMLNSIVTELRQNLARIRHHACLGLVCGNNEIEWHFHDYVALSGREDREHFEKVYLDLFESMIPDLVSEVAPELAYIPSSPTSGGRFQDPNGERMGDCHDWEADYLLCRGRGYRYVSEFGFQSLPCFKTIESFTEEDDRNLNSKIMDRHQRSNGGNELIQSFVTRSYRYPCNLEDYVYVSQVLQAEAIRYKVEHFRRHRGRCMGTLYWQLNDIWPVTSWSSIDSAGRYKALQYAAKRFYSPILISCEEMGEMQQRRFVNTEAGTFGREISARLCVTNDLTEETRGVVRWQVMDENSNLLSEGAKEVTVAARSALWLDKLCLDEFDPERIHLHYDFLCEGRVLSEGTVLFTVPKYYRFVNPELCCEIMGDEIVIKSQAYARAVQIEGVDGDLLLSDNFFDMEKGEKRVKILSGETKQIRLRSLFDIR